MTMLALMIVGWLVVVAFVMAILTAAKRGDEAMTSAYPADASGIEMLPGDTGLGQFTGEVAIELGAERVIVVIGNPAEPSTGVVAACLGTPGLVGQRVPMPTERATGVAQDWHFAQIPLKGMAEAAGAVAVASPGRRSFTDGDLGLVERLARSQLAQFDRRRVPRSPAMRV
jgi:hypothetical protein